MPLITDPIDLLVDADEDITLENGDLVFASGVDAVVQGVKFELLLIRGDWYLDLDEGVPYFENDSVDESQALIGQKFNEVKTRATIREAIARAPGVREIISLAVKFDRATRQLSASFAVRTDFGDSEVEELAL